MEKDNKYIDKVNKQFLESGSFIHKKEGFFISPASAVYTIPYFDMFYVFYYEYFNRNYKHEFVFKIKKNLVFDENFEIIGEDLKSLTLQCKNRQINYVSISQFLNGLKLETHIPSKILPFLISANDVSLFSIENILLGIWVSSLSPSKN